MRWLFLLMVVLNLSYIAWEMTNSAKIKPLQAGNRQNVPTIRLLSEVDKAKNTATEQSAFVKDSSGKADNKLADVAAQNETGINNEDQQQIMEQTAEVSAVQTEVVAENVTQDKPAQDKSVQDKSVQDKSVQDKSVQDKSVNGKKQPSPDVCYTLGPFRDLKKLHVATRDIRQYATETNVRSQKEKELSLFWVYLKPLASRVQAKKIGRQLRARKIKDFYIIREGVNNNGISLGYFKNKKSAYRLAEKVKKKGFKVVVEPMFKNYTAYWLDYQVTGGMSIPEVIFGKYMQSENKDKITRLSRACKSG